MWLFLLERFLTCVGSISLEPDNTGAPTDGILLLPLPIAKVAAPHLVRICWDVEAPRKQPCAGPCATFSAPGSSGHLLLVPAASLSFGLYSLVWGLFFLT